MRPATPTDQMSIWRMGSSMALYLCVGITRAIDLRCSPEDICIKLSHSSLPLCIFTTQVKLYPLKIRPAAFCIFVAAAGINRGLCKCPVALSHTSDETLQRQQLTTAQWPIQR